MRIYSSCREMYSEEKRNLHEMGIMVHPQTMQDKNVGDDADFRTLELSPCVFTVIDGGDRDQWLRELNANLPWARAELQDRWNALNANDPGMFNPGSAYTKRLNIWIEYLHDGKFAYTYGERFTQHQSLARVVNELAQRPDTRQAVLPMFCAPKDHPNLGGLARVPCTMHYQFLRRPDGLRCIYVMRSTDFVTHFPYDVWFAMGLQEHIAQELGIKTSYFTFFSGSLHLYAKDADPGVF